MDTHLIVDSCGKKGCSARDLTLPNDGKLIMLSGKVYGERNDIQRVLQPDLLLAMAA